MGETGLREVPEECLQCPEKTACLRRALESPEGLMVQGAALERTPPKGLLGRLRRWSERKDLDRRIREKQGEKRTWWR
jgi:hypothetical protein